MEILGAKEFNIRLHAYNILKLMTQTSFEQYQRQWVTTLSAGYIDMSNTQEMW